MTLRMLKALLFLQKAMNKYQLGKQSQWLCDKDCKSVVKPGVFF